MYTPNWLAGTNKDSRAAMATLPDMQAALARPRRIVLQVIGVLALICLVVAGSYIVNSRRAVVEDVRRDASLHARVVESHLSRLMAAATNLGAALAADARLQAPVLDHPLATQLLSTQVAGQPSLRSLALVAADGRVLASSYPRDVGQLVDLGQLGLRAEDSRPSFLGPMLQARTLFDLAQGSSAGNTGLPLLHRLPGKPTRWLVTLINADYLGNDYALLMQNEGLRALVLQADGTLISSTSYAGADTGPGPGTPLGKLAPFTRFLPAAESGWYEGPASHGGRAVAVFRMTRAWPLVVLVENDLAQVQQLWLDRVELIAMVATTLMATLLLMGWLAERGLRREQTVHEHAASLRDKLSQAEQRWRIAIDAASHGVWEYDFVTKCVRLSCGFMRILGHLDPPRETQLTFDEAQAVMGQHNYTEAVGQLSMLLSGERHTVELELRMLGLDGVYRWVLLRGTLVGARMTDGRVTKLIGTATDISAQKLVQQQLLSSETRLNALLQSAIEGIVSVDDQERVVLFNPAAARIFGWTQQDAIGVPLSSFIPNRFRAGHRTHMDLLASRGTATTSAMNVVSGLRRDGEEFPLETAFSHCRVDGRDYFTAIVRDLSEERRMQAELQASESRLRALFDHAAVGMLEEAVRGEPWVPADCRYVSCNSALCEMLGYTTDELLALRADELVHADDIEDGGMGLRELIAGRLNVFVNEKRLRRHDGRYLWVQVARSLVPGHDPHELRFLFVIADISERRAARVALEQARQREMAISAHIQQSLLVSPPDQRLPGLWLSTLNQASQGADGDFVEVMQMGEGTVDVVVGDVMGKGMAAALLGAAVKMEIARCTAELMARQDADQGLPGPAVVVAALHRHMAKNLLTVEAFVTLSYLRLDTRLGRVTWVGCGHEEPVLVRAGSQEIVALANQQPPLGVLLDCQFEESVLPMGPSDCVLLASDGATDALLPDGSRIGRDFVLQRLCEHLRELPTPGAVLHALKRDIQRSNATFVDDVTLALAMGATGSRRELSGGLDDMVHVRGLVGHRARAAGLDDEAADLFTVGAAEAYANAVIHTCGRPEGAPVEMVVNYEPGRVEVEFVTLGDPYEPPAPVDEFDFSAYPEGGFGLTIMHRTSDRVQTRHQGGANIVTLERHAVASDAAVAQAPT
jgi:PAS domain S-box-containing protein